MDLCIKGLLSHIHKFSIDFIWFDPRDSLERKNAFVLELLLQNKLFKPFIREVLPSCERLLVVIVYDQQSWFRSGGIKTSMHHEIWCDELFPISWQFNGHCVVIVAFLVEALEDDLIKVIDRGSIETHWRLKSRFIWTSYLIVRVS